MLTRTEFEISYVMWLCFDYCSTVALELRYNKSGLAYLVLSRNPINKKSLVKPLMSYVYTYLLREWHFNPGIEQSPCSSSYGSYT